MKSQIGVIIGLAAAFVFVMLVGITNAGIISDPLNLLEGQATLGYPVYPGAATDPVPGVVDGDVYPGDVTLNWYDGKVLVHGFSSALDRVRIWGYVPEASGWPIEALTIKSSTANNSLLSDTFETTLVSEHVPSWTANPLPGLPGVVYEDIAVGAPVGTQSLLLDFNVGAGHYTYTRLEEVQAFAPIPEPGTLMLLATGLIGLLAYAWRKQK